MNYRKQIVIGIMALLISLICSTTCMATTAIVNTDTLKLRKEASTDSTVLELLNQGEKLEIIEESGDWYKVKVNKMTGFVHKDYIKVDEDTTETKTEEPKTEETTKQEEPAKEETSANQEQPVNEETNTTTENNSNNVVEETKEESFIGKQTLKSDSNAYILPLINSSKIGKLNKGEEVLVLDEVKGWAYIQTDDINAWIRKDVLKEENTNTTTTKNDDKANNNDIQEQEIEKKVLYVNSPSIYVRKGPATTYEVVDTLVQNNQVTAIAESDDWYKVELGNGTQGYIAKRLLSASKAKTTSRGAEERTTEETEKIVQADQVVQTSENTTTSSSKGEEIAEYAKQFLGSKYVYGGSGPSTFDCSGFTMYVYKNFGISLSHSARAQSSNGTYVSKEELEPGDLVFFKDYETMDGIGHCGIYIGDGNFIHASSGTGYCVKISTLLSGSYNTRYETARRLI